jgi:hypothetical protein
MALPLARITEEYALRLAQLERKAEDDMIWLREVVSETKKNFYQ